MVVVLRGQLSHAQVGVLGFELVWWRCCHNGNLIWKMIELEGYMQYYYGLVCKGASNTANFAIQSKADPRSVLAELPLTDVYCK